MSWENQFENFQEDMEKKKEESLNLFEELKRSVENENEGKREETITLRIGGKIVRFEVAEEQKIPEEEVEEEIKQKYQEKLEKIRDTLNEKVSEIYSTWESYKEELEEKEKQLKERLESSNVMPEITFKHAKEGLSVVKGQGNQVYHWLYRTVYWPKYLNRVPLNPSFTKKLITPVIIMITTEKEYISNITVRKINNLDKFQHYHSVGDSSDCWGETWKWNRQWNTPDDIIKLGKEATSILEEINEYSLGRSNPVNLPRFNTVKNNTDPEADWSELKMKKEDLRQGISTEEHHNETRDVSWTLD